MLGAKLIVLIVCRFVLITTYGFLCFPVRVDVYDLFIPGFKISGDGRMWWWEVHYPIIGAYQPPGKLDSLGCGRICPSLYSVYVVCVMYVCLVWSDYGLWTDLFW